MFVKAITREIERDKFNAETVPYIQFVQVQRSGRCLRLLTRIKSFHLG